MNLWGPLWARLVFHGFVVLVGVLILAGAHNGNAANQVPEISGAICVGDDHDREEGRQSGEQQCVEPKDDCCLL